MCLFGEAFACSVRVGMQKGAKSSELCACVCEQYQIAMFHLKSGGETSQDAQTSFPTWVSHLGQVPWVTEELWTYRRCSQTAAAGKQWLKRPDENRLHSN